LNVSGLRLQVLSAAPVVLACLMFHELLRGVDSRYYHWHAIFVFD
jgi:hypothetical protein